MAEFSTWAETARQLVDVAMGRSPADLVIRGGQWVNVHSREVIPATDLAITAGRFAYCGPDASHTIGDDTQVIAAEGQFLVPGLCDGHMHIESGMVTATEFARAVIPHGTTTMFVDPHEVANVMGWYGVRMMNDEAMGLPINIFIQMPSCVPSAPGLEHSGASVAAPDVETAMDWPNIVGLGEMMNFPAVAANDPAIADIIAEAMKAGKTVGGHYASPDLGLPFHGYVAGGPADDHEGTRKEDAIARVRQGMRAMMRLGSAWYDVATQVKAVTEDGLDPRNFILCTDDCHSGTLVNEGHMNRVVRHAIDEGLDPLIALQMATINTATHFGMERDLGSIAPGRRADVILTPDLKTLPIEMVIARGAVLARQGQLTADIPPAMYSSAFKGTVIIDHLLTSAEFDIMAPEGATEVKARVIGVVENQAPTVAREATLPVAGGIVGMDRAKDIAQIALVERHTGQGTVQNAFVNGFGYSTDCALASTVAHDSHHLLVVGTNKADMALASNRLAEIGGGVVLYAGGEEKAIIELPIAGLMSDQRAEVVAEKAEALMAAMKSCGCDLNNAYMQHTLLALVVIPELRISDIGLVDVTKFETTELLI